MKMMITAAAIALAATTAHAEQFRPTVPGLHDGYSRQLKIESERQLDENYRRMNDDYARRIELDALEGSMRRRMNDIEFELRDRERSSGGATLPGVCRDLFTGC